MRILVTGSSGLIGSEAVRYFGGKGHQLFGIDNNMRRVFFGPAGDTSWNLRRLQDELPGFEHHDLDIRDREKIDALFATARFDAIIHCAAQPSHDKAKEAPLVDFDVNAGGTLNLLESTRRHCPDAAFVFMSTNKVYGDAPNRLALTELETRWDYALPEHRDGIDETCPIDASLHSIFGASKVAADVMTQEYGRYFGMKTVAFRAGCLTGPSHSGVELHGFLSYLVRTAASGGKYTIYGYKGKQVRDQIHSLDVARAIEAFLEEPRCGEVYNLGGGRENSASVLECIDMVGQATNSHLNTGYVDKNRLGDHICYISDYSKFRSHYPRWRITRSLPEIISEMTLPQASRPPSPTQA